MPSDLEVKNLTHHITHILDAWVTELVNVIAIEADQVVMLPETERPLEGRLFGAELVPNNQIALHQQVERIVDRGSAYSDFGRLEPFQQLVSVKMSINGINLVKNGESFRCLAQVALLQVADEPLLDVGQLLCRQIGHATRYT